MADNTIRVMVADDQPDIRSAFKLIVDSQPDMVVAGEATDGTTALKVARELTPDVMLMDIRMPRTDGLDVAGRLVHDPRTAGIQVVVLTTFQLDECVGKALMVGACGFLLKRSSPTLLIEGIRAAMAGDRLINPQITVRLLRHLAALPEPSGTPATENLSARETEIACRVAHGKTNGEIAAELNISPAAVNSHLTDIGSKLGTRNRVGLAAWSWQNGITEPGQ